MAQDFITREGRIGATYARVSTIKQKEGISLDDQQDKMLAYATNEGIEVPARYRFQEQASGFSDVRECYDEIRALIRKGAITDLIVYSSDRHTRDPIHGDIFRTELRRAGVTLHFVNEGGAVDITTPMGKFMRRQIDSFNALWGETIRELTVSRKAGYTEDGIPYVQGFAKYGLERVGKRKDAHLVKVDDEAAIVLNIYTWYDQGLSVDRLGELLHGTDAPGDRVRNPKRKRAAGEWSPSTIYSILRDPVYRGVYYANCVKMVYDDRTDKNTKRQKLTSDEGRHPINVPAIVPDDLWYRVQARLEARRKASSHERGKHQYLLTARSTCRHCGASVTGNTGSNKIGYYRCNRRYARFYVDRGCDMKPANVVACDVAVWDKLKELLKKPEALRAMLLDAHTAQRQEAMDIEAMLETIDATIAEQQKELNGYTRAIAAEYAQDSPNMDIVSVLRVQADERTVVIKKLEDERTKQVARLNQKVVSPAYIDCAVVYAESIHDRLDNATFEEQRDAIEHFDIRFEFERRGENNQELIIHVQWLIWEWDLLIEAGRPSRHSPSESSPSEWRRSQPSCGR
jgi:site-specific DNA recombinase